VRKEGMLVTSAYLFDGGFWGGTESAFDGREVGIESSEIGCKLSKGWTWDYTRSPKISKENRKRMMTRKAVVVCIAVSVGIAQHLGMRMVAVHSQVGLTRPSIPIVCMFLSLVIFSTSKDV
jgi:hypothetical protein